MRLFFAALFLPIAIFGATESVSIDTKTKKVQNPIVNFGAGNTLNGTGATIIGFPGSSYTFIDSLTQSAGNVSLVNDSASPGNSKYYGTDSGGVLGFHTVTGGGGTPGGSDTDVQVNVSGAFGAVAPYTFHSTGDSNDPTTHPYTAATAGIVVKDVNDDEVWHIFADVASESLFIGEGTGENKATGESQNLAVGYDALANLTTGGSNTAIGYQALNLIEDTFDNTAVGWKAGHNLIGNDNTWVGYTTQPTTTQAANACTVIGSRINVHGSNVIAIGDSVVNTTDNTAVIGNGSLSDVTFGDGTAIMHGSLVQIPNLTTNGFVKTSGGDGTLSATPIVGGFTAHFSRGGEAIQVGDQTFTPWTTKSAGTISGYIISVYPSGTCTLKVWKKATGTSIPTIADVINTSGVSLSTGTHIDNATVSDFTTTTVADGDQFIAVVTATSGTATDITFQVPITR